MPRVLILKAGATFGATRRRFGDYDRWFMDALRGAEATYRVHDLTLGGTVDLGGCDAVIVTGSPSSVYERLPWMGDLERILRRLAERQDLPTLGVCFGAQALASALGGRVNRNPRGWEIGTVEVRTTPAVVRDAVLTGSLPVVRFQATHQDWIETLPADAEILAENRMSPFQAFRIGERVWGTQFHPEASPAILEDLIRARRRLLEAESGPEGYERRLQSLEATPEGGSLLRRFVGRAAG